MTEPARPDDIVLVGERRGAWVPATTAGLEKQTLVDRISALEVELATKQKHLQLLAAGMREVACTLGVLAEVSEQA